MQSKHFSHMPRMLLSHQLGDAMRLQPHGLSTQECFVLVYKLCISTKISLLQVPYITPAVVLQTCLTVMPCFSSQWDSFTAQIPRMWPNCGSHHVTHGCNACQQLAVSIKQLTSLSAPLPMTHPNAGYRQPNMLCLHAHNLKSSALTPMNSSNEHERTRRNPAAEPKQLVHALN